MRGNVYFLLDEGCGRLIEPLSLQEPDVIEQLWSLQHQAYRLEAREIGLTNYLPMLETFDALRNSSELFYGELSDDRDLLGAVALTHGDGTERANEPQMMAISRLMVHPQHLRQGIGSALVKYAIDCHPYIRYVMVTAGTMNVPALRLYERLGFLRRGSYLAAEGLEMTVLRLER